MDARPDETRPALWAFASFFTLLAGYYVLRSLREEMGIRGGVDNLPWNFTATFGLMLVALPLYSRLVARVPRARAVPLVYRFFLVTLVGFWALFRAGVAPAPLARAFFVWVSVYGLFVVSVFWSLLVDLFSTDQGKRLFGLVAAGGSAGAIAGPLLVEFLVGLVGVPNLILVSAVLLEVSTQSMGRIVRWSRRRRRGAGRRRRAAPGGAREGPLGRERLERRGARLPGPVPPRHRPADAPLHAGLDAPLLPGGPPRRRLGARLGGADAPLRPGGPRGERGRAPHRARSPPGGSSPGSGWARPWRSCRPSPRPASPWRPAGPPSGCWPHSRRCAGRPSYAVERPAREVLYTVVTREERYKSKAFVDTVVYRAGDAGSAWLARGLAAAGAGVAGSLLLAVPVGLAGVGARALARPRGAAPRGRGAPGGGRRDWAA